MHSVILMLTVLTLFTSDSALKNGSSSRSNEPGRAAGTGMPAAVAPSDHGITTGALRLSFAQPAVSGTDPADGATGVLRDVIITAEVLLPNGGISSALVRLSGLAGFNNPLDLTENPSNGHVYVSEYGDAGAITLLRPTTATASTPPTVALTAPANGVRLAEGVDIVIEADAADAEGAITKVEFFANGTLLGEATTAPYAFTWTGAAAGSYSLTAMATDDQGEQATSTPVSVAVGGASNPYLVLYWPLDEGSGITTEDASGNGFTGMFMGDPTWTTGQYGQALSFDGDGDFVEVFHEPGLNPTETLTLMAWFCKSPTGGTTSTGLEKRDSFRLVFKDTNVDSSLIQFDFWAEDGDFERLESNSKVAAGEWHHVAGVYANRRMMIYIDGALDAARTAAGPIRPSNLPFRIGRREFDRFYAGEIDEVYLYNRGLTQAEIQLAMQGNGTHVSVEEEAELIEGYELSEAYPNPFNPAARLHLRVRDRQLVEAAVYDVTGRRVAVLYAGEVGPNTALELRVDGRTWPSGLYLMRAVGERFTVTRKLTLLK